MEVQASNLLQVRGNLLQVRGVLGDHDQDHSGRWVRNLQCELERSHYGRVVLSGPGRGGGLRRRYCRQVHIHIRLSHSQVSDGLAEGRPGPGRRVLLPEYSGYKWLIFVKYFDLRREMSS